MITTLTILQLGDVLAGNVTVQSLDRQTATESLVKIVAQSSVVFDTGMSTFHSNLDIRSIGNVQFSSAVAVTLGYCWILADSDSDGTGSSIVDPSTTLSVSLAGTDVRITSSDVSLGASAYVSLGSAHLYLSATGTLPLQLGNAATAGTHVDITSTEAICIKTTAASASWIVQSKTITVRGTADTVVECCRARFACRWRNHYIYDFRILIRKS